MKKLKLTKEQMDFIINGMYAYDRYLINSGYYPKGKEEYYVQYDNEEMFCYIQYNYYAFINKKTMEIGLGYEWNENALFDIDEEDLQELLDNASGWE